MPQTEINYKRHHQRHHHGTTNGTTMVPLTAPPVARSGYLEIGPWKLSYIFNLRIL
jgi:hypothetical protein